MSKRIFLFIMTNILVIITISVITSILGLHPYLNQHGIDYASLALFCAIWGMTGAFISLLFSKVIAKMAMGVVVLHEKHGTTDERDLLDLVHSLSRKAGLTVMPEVGIYQSAEVNAFATGPSKHNSLIAVSSTMLSSMNRPELEGVLGHEISHIVNGDMVTMTLVQGIINAFSMFLSRVIAYAITLALSHDEEKQHEVSHTSFYIVSLVLDILFTALGSVLVAAYSRHREYRADAGSARLSATSNMVAALKRLERFAGIEDDRAPTLSAFKISHHPNLFDIFSSHPPLPQRIARLEQRP